MPTAKATHLGHRDRVRNRFLWQGLRAFADYEVLELLLFYVIPRRDTKPLAHMLIREFGSLSGVLHAPEEALCRVSGIGARAAHFLSRLLPFAEYVVRREPFPAAYATANDLGEFFVEYYRDNKSLSVDVALLNNRCEILKLMHIGNRSMLSCAKLLQDIIVVAHEYNAPIVALGSYKPHGIPIPSEADLDFTRDLLFALNDVGLQLLENIFVAQDQFNPLLHYLQKHARQELPNGFAALRGSRSRRAPSSDILGPSVEWLTEMLSYAMSKSAAEAVATDLLRYFSTLSTILSFDCERLAQEKGMTMSAAILLKVLSALHSRVGMQDVLAARPVCDTQNKMGRMFLQAMGGLAHEVCVLALFDEDMRLMDIHFMAEGTANMVHIKDGEFVRVALRARAPYVAVAHNHPGGIALPSQEDFSSTVNMLYQFHSIGIRMLEHFVVTDRQYSAVCTYGEVHSDAPPEFYEDSCDAYRYDPDPDR